MFEKIAQKWDHISQRNQHYVNDVIITIETSIFGIQFYFLKAMLLLNVSTKFE